MTIYVACLRKLPKAAELVFISDSRLSGGYSWDTAKNSFFPVTGLNAVLSFAGPTGLALPVVHRIRATCDKIQRVRMFFDVAGAQNEAPPSDSYIPNCSRGETCAALNLPIISSEASSALLEFDQGAAKVLRIEKENRLAMRPDLGRSIAENARAASFQAVPRGENIIHLIAEMMDSAIRTFGDKFGDRRIFSQRLKQLDLGIRQLDEGDQHAMFTQGDRGADFCAQRVAIDCAGGRQIPHRDRDVVQPPDHNSRFPRRLRAE